MKRLQNSLYITKQDTYVHKQRETLVIKVDKEKVMQLPIHAISALNCFGRVTVSPQLMGFCAENNVNLAYFTEYGRFLARMQGKQTGNIILRKAQYKRTEQDPVSIARNIIISKLRNSKILLQRHIRNHGEAEEFSKAIKSISHSIERVKFSSDLDKIRGYEGEAAATYFSVFNDLLQVDEVTFNGRNRRPPRDPVNALLSFVYSLLGQDISAALQGVGLDPQAGFLHSDRSGRDSLAQDILEEFRAWWADRLVLTLFNRKQLTPKDFNTEISGAVRLTDEGRKTFFKAYQEKKQQEILHPYLKEKVNIGLLPHVQALLLARHLRGDLQEYPPFYMR